MINPGKTLTINDAREILVRRLWYALIPFVVICVGTVLFAIYAPREYRATTLVLVTPQKVPERITLAL
jgi:uncharacterized protein involved in exopolysaccharide biosynthesis